MAPTKKVQTERIRQFRATVSCTARTAERYLAQCSWSVDRALNVYLDSGESDTGFDVALSRLFAKYCSKEDNVIQPSGVISFLNDCSIDPMDSESLMFACKCGCVTPGYITEEEFKRGMSEMFESSAIDITKLKGCLQSDSLNQESFKQTYRYAYVYTAGKRKSRISKADACQLWSIVLRDRWTFLDQWVEFVKASDQLYITRDSWNLVLLFSEISDYAAYDPTGAYPVICDQFVEWLKSKT